MVLLSIHNIIWALMMVALVRNKCFATVHTVTFHWQYGGMCISTSIIIKSVFHNNLSTTSAYLVFNQKGDHLSLWPPQDPPDLFPPNTNVTRSAKTRHNVAYIEFYFILLLLCMYFEEYVVQTSQIGSQMWSTGLRDYTG